MRGRRDVVLERDRFSPIGDPAAHGESVIRCPGRGLTPPWRRAKQPARRLVLARQVEIYPAQWITAAPRFPSCCPPTTRRRTSPPWRRGPPTGGGRPGAPKNGLWG